jgi:hypothetical protein
MKDDPTVFIGGKHIIDVQSYVSNEDKHGYVSLTWGREKGKLTPAEARAHALRILEAADAAESDEFIVDWLLGGNHAGKKLVENLQQSVMVLRDFRAFRDRKLKEGNND